MVVSNFSIAATGKEDKNVEKEDVQDLLSSFSSTHMLPCRIEMYNFHEYLTELP